MLVGVRMWYIFLYIILFVYIPFVSSLVPIGPGKWLVLEIHKCDKCDNPETYELQIDVKSRKSNRTHNCFDVRVDLVNEINVTYGLDIEIYQEVDGGFKYYQTMKYDSMCKLFKESTEENMKQFLNLANVDPPDCPFPPSPLIVNNFVMDYGDLPKIGVYGTFESRSFLIYLKKRIACLRLILKFEIIRDEDESDEDLGSGFVSKLKTKHQN